MGPPPTCNTFDVVPAVSPSKTPLRAAEAVGTHIIRCVQVVGVRVRVRVCVYVYVCVCVCARSPRVYVQFGDRRSCACVRVCVFVCVCGTCCGRPRLRTNGVRLKRLVGGGGGDGVPSVWFASGPQYRPVPPRAQQLHITGRGVLVLHSA